MFLLQTPVHSNLGDHAIAYAELLLLQNLSVIEITDYQLNILLKFPDIIRKIIGDCEILITGGGNLGTLWISIEENIRRVLELFSENRIIPKKQIIKKHYIFMDICIMVILNYILVTLI